MMLSTRAKALVAKILPRALSAPHTSLCLGDNVLKSDKHGDASLHRFTRGRFVCNEEYEMRQHHVDFDLRQLEKLAARAANATRCVHVKKFPDGLHNKALLMTMDDGKEVVVKLPNPNAGRPHFTTASEVATLDFIRSCMSIPVPKVLSWSSKAESNPVGAEYIIMEKANGVSLESVWPRMKLADRLTIMKTLVEYQKLWASTPFPAYGSLYYDSDLSSDTHSVPCESQASFSGAAFVIGPSEGRDWIDDGRMLIEFDRGPWTSALDYLTAVGKRERECIRQMPVLPKSPITLCGPNLYQPKVATKLKAVDCYFELLHIVSPSDSVLNRPCIWHSDLHVENIFVDPDEPTRITSIIDWQSSEVAPLYIHARQPYLMDYDCDDTLSLERPRKPDYYSELSPGEKQRADQLLFDRSLCVLYRILVSKTVPDIWKCLQFRQTTAFDLILTARNLLTDGEAVYLAHALELLEDGAPISGVEDQSTTLPISFSAEEKKQIMSDIEAATLGMRAMSGIKDALGDLFPERGIVKSERYDEAKDALQQMKEQVIEQFAHSEEERAAWMRSWPFDD
ncbi:Altered inheritance of mitochondria protein 9, mitochondrial [Cercospora beticola]|uniref:Altered inheritance of mitochondria protein 9, mitochondrial n=1 Tax=Cercospora beticola TaxID=122368 RepID=A0A2G5HBQ8_CERBT|nr:Altered inheritance of mitochondria protein 9, mitochondrial [Cercospora beticola]PIA89672.1 Altered inheritance of mitochondria protein 9, mitochondrial [Cercospora beticola]WPB03039.1 hypothetical protein RHO25_007676 [Cercospora beticola]